MGRKRTASEMSDDPLPDGDAAEEPSKTLALTMGLGEEHDEQTMHTPDTRAAKRRRIVKKVHFDGAALADLEDDDGSDDDDFTPIEDIDDDEESSDEESSDDESSDSSDSSSESSDLSSDSSISDSSDSSLSDTSDSSLDSSSDESDSDSSVDITPLKAKRVPLKSKPAVEKPGAKAKKAHQQTEAPKAKKSSKPKASETKEASEVKKPPGTKKVPETKKALELKKAPETKTSEPKKASASKKSFEPKESSDLKKATEPKKAAVIKKTSGLKKVAEVTIASETTVQQPEDQTDAKSRRLVPPGMGNPATKKRNERRKNKKLALAENSAKQVLSLEENNNGDPIDDTISTITTTPVAAENTTAGADASSGDQDPIPRPKLDLSSSRRLVFGALGVSTPKSKEDAQKISQKLMQRSLRPSLEHKMQKPDATEEPQPVTTPTQEPHHLSDEWKSKINLVAVDCLNGKSITPPPYPFVQQWSKAKKQKGMRWEEEYGAPQSGGSNAGSTPSSTGSPTGFGGSSMTLDSRLDMDGVPHLPADMTTLKDARPEDVVCGTVLTFKQLELSAATGWQPVVSGYRTAEVENYELPPLAFSALAGVSENLPPPAADGAESSAQLKLDIRLARRDVPKTKVRYDNEGYMVPSKFDMPMLLGEEDDGRRSVRFADLIGPKVVRQPADWSEQREAMRAHVVVAAPVVVNAVGDPRDRNTSSPESSASGSSA
jgi:hypothetical protein